jgi:hypothetical protein
VSGIVEEADIRRPPALGRTRGEFEMRAVAGGTAELDDQLLDGEVACVGSLPVDIRLQPNDQRPTDSQADPLPTVERESAAEPSFRSAYRATADPDLSREVRLGDVLSRARGSNVSAGTRELLTVPPRGLRGQIGAPASRHDRFMFIPGSCQRLIVVETSERPSADPSGRA